MVHIGNLGKKQSVPRVVLAQRVVRKMAQGAALYPEEETAEAMVGLVLPNTQGPPDFYVLDTIAPDWDAIEREVAMVEQGDDLQDEIMYWFSINWRRFRQMRSQSYGSARSAKWDAPLRYLGDWHKQPGDMFWPSQGDLATAQAIVREEANDMPQLLAPIVTIAPPWEEGSDPPGDDYDLYVIQDDGPRIRVNFWYLSREMRQFVAAKPEVKADDLLPSLPSLAWHLTDRARFQREYDDLSDDGLAVSIVEWDADEVPPMEVCFMVGRMGGQHVLMLITDKDYPQVPPTVRLAPMLTVGEDGDLFKTLWDESIPYPTEGLPGYSWSPEMRLLDLVKAVEAQL